MPGPKPIELPDTAIDDYENGMGTTEVGKKYGVAPNTAARFLRRRGVVLRAAGIVEGTPQAWRRSTFTDADALKALDEMGVSR